MNKVAGLIHFFRPRAPSIVEYRHDWWEVAEYLTSRCAAVVLAGCGCPIGNRRVGGCKPFLGCPFLLSMIRKQPVISCHIMLCHQRCFFRWLKRYETLVMLPLREGRKWVAIILNHPLTPPNPTRCSSSKSIFGKVQSPWGHQSHNTGWSSKKEDKTSQNWGMGWNYMRLQWDDEEKPVFVLSKSPLPSDKLT